MPWAPRDVAKKTRKAKSPKAKRQWVDVANSELKRTGSDSIAIRAANSVVAKRKRRA